MISNTLVTRTHPLVTYGLHLRSLLKANLTIAQSCHVSSSLSTSDREGGRATGRHVDHVVFIAGDPDGDSLRNPPVSTYSLQVGSRLIGPGMATYLFLEVRRQLYLPVHLDLLSARVLLAERCDMLVGWHRK